MRAVLKSMARAIGLGLVRSERLDQLKEIESECSQLFELLAKANGLAKEGKAQLHQDLFVLLETSFKRDGFFVEFGATNGVGFSNTHLLEKHFGWKGILAEPAKIWHEDLRRNRSASIEFDCVWRESGKTLNFNMVHEAELSTISAFNDRDQHSAKRQLGTSYEVKTVSLLDLLKRHNAPSQIDYLSIDTEGSEFDILSGFDFNSYRISIITCEHNFTKDRQKIYDLLTSKGFGRKFHGLSQWDDWYVNLF